MIRPILNILYFEDFHFSLEKCGMHFITLVTLTECCEHIHQIYKSLMACASQSWSLVSKNHNSNLQIAKITKLSCNSHSSVDTQRT